MDGKCRSKSVYEKKSEFPDLLSQALPVARLVEVDLNSPPITGEDYLTRVR